MGDTLLELVESQFCSPRSYSTQGPCLTVSSLPVVLHDTAEGVQRVQWQTNRHYRT